MQQVLATSENLAIRFDPPLLDLDPILPFVDESERLVTVHNETDSEIEVTGSCNLACFCRSVGWANFAA
jgi:hypothetical protein